MAFEIIKRKNRGPGSKGFNSFSYGLVIVIINTGKTTETKLIPTTIIVSRNTMFETIDLLEIFLYIFRTYHSRIVV